MPKKTMPESSLSIMPSEAIKKSIAERGAYSLQAFSTDIVAKHKGEYQSKAIEKLDSLLSPAKIEPVGCVETAPSGRLKLNQKGKEAVQAIYEDVLAEGGNLNENVTLAVSCFRDEVYAVTDGKLRHKFIDGKVEATYPLSKTASKEEKEQVVLKRRALKRILNGIAAKARYEIQKQEDAEYITQAVDEYRKEKGTDKRPNAAELSKRVKALKAADEPFIRAAISQYQEQNQTTYLPNKSELKERARVLKIQEENWPTSEQTTKESLARLRKTLEMVKADNRTLAETRLGRRLPQKLKLALAGTALLVLASYLASPFGKSFTNDFVETGLKARDTIVRIVTTEIEKYRALISTNSQEISPESQNIEKEQAQKEISVRQQAVKDKLSVEAEISSDKTSEENHAAEQKAAAEKAAAEKAAAEKAAAEKLAAEKASQAEIARQQELARQKAEAEKIATEKAAAEKAAAEKAAAEKLAAEKAAKEKAPQSILEQATTPSKEIEGVRILKILTTEEAKKMAAEGKLFFKNNHPIVIEEAEFLWFWASQPKEVREKLLDAYAESIIEGLANVYDINSRLVVGLEAGHMSSAPKGLRTQDTGTAATLREGGTIAEKTVNLQLSKIIAKKISQKYPKWITVINVVDDKGFPVEQFATYEGNEYDIRALDAAILMRYNWERLGEEGPMVKIAVHFNGGANNPRGGETIPQAEGQFRPQSQKISQSIAVALTKNVRNIIPDYQARLIERDEKEDPYAITDSAEDQIQDVLSGIINKIRCKANRYVVRVINAEKSGGKPFIRVATGETPNS